MRNKKDELAARNRKKKNKGIDAIIVLVFIILAGSVIWIGVNGLSKKKSDEHFIEQENTDTVDKETNKASYESDEASKSEERSSVQNKKDAVVENKQINEQQTEESETKGQVEYGDKAGAPEEPITEKAEEAEPRKPSNPIGYIEGQELPKEPKFVDGVLLANKQYPLPADYAPEESKEARAEFEKLAIASEAAGINLQAFSTYRPYDYQVTLYERYVERDGQKGADRYSARPGYSEHQTGLAFDIGEVNREKHWASNSFGNTEAAKWLAANAYKYGFILRYPEGKEEITGYMHESWHYRYVGKDMSEKIFKQNITLEEYLGVR